MLVCIMPQIVGLLSVAMLNATDCHLDLSTLSLVAAVKAVRPKKLAFGFGNASKPWPAIRFALWAAFFLLNILLQGFQI